MKQFEYQMKIVEMLDENLLNAYGKNGWELAAVINDPAEGIVVCLKREIDYIRINEKNEEI